ncbi:MAG: hypothetical protein JXL80_12860 [Planctomycetes bacterium]|nr:hypothetical protein [Planctomycetota bacterium]
MNRLVVFALLLIPLSAATGLGESLEVNQAEILRLGDLVQHVDAQRHGQDAEDLFVEAMRPPADDSDKWYISVVVTRSCAACQKLKSDWAADPSLRALADPGDPNRSWAHYRVYYYEDQSQAWRWEKLTFERFPTILVQPPRNKKFGEPSTVVFQGTYDGNPRQLATQIAQAIRLYVTKLADAQGQNNRAAGGVFPPWEPAPSDDTAPDSGRRLIPPLVPEEMSLQVDFPWKAILTLFTAGLSIPAIIALVIWLLVFIRAGRKEAGKQLLVDDETFAKLLGVLEQFADSGQRGRATKTTGKKATTKA